MVERSRGKVGGALGPAPESRVCALAPPPAFQPVHHAGSPAHLFGDPMNAEPPALHDTRGSGSGARAENGLGRLVERPEVQDVLRRLVHNLCHDPNLYEELLQEALLCHWRTEVSDPGHTLSWYLERCRFRIQHYFNQGRSVDSLKHSHSACSLDELDELELPVASDLRQEICARDEREELARRLDPVERQTLELRCEDLSEREIAQQEHVRPATIIERCRHTSAPSPLAWGFALGTPREPDTGILQQ